MKCILHIGTEKTASTLLQHWLYENEKNLSDQGVALTSSALTPNNRKLASLFQVELDDFIFRNNVRTQAEKDEFLKDLKSEFAAEIAEKSKTHDTVVLTCEHFHSRLKSAEEVAALHEFLSGIFSEFVVLCYFREQSKVRTSLYSTAVKINYGNELSEFRKDTGPDSHYFNYFEFFKKWEAAFGKDALRPRLFDKEHLVDGDIRKDFVATVLPDINKDALSYETLSANESFSSSQAELAKQINKERPWFIWRHADPTPRFYKRLLSKLEFLNNKQSIQDPRQLAMYEDFDESNRAFFERYFGEDKNLFEKPKPAQDENKSLSADEKDIGELFQMLLEKENLIILKKEEITRLHRLAMELFKAGHISRDDAIMMVTVAHRARPTGKHILSSLERLYKKKK